MAADVAASPSQTSAGPGAGPSPLTIAANSSQLSFSEQQAEISMSQATNYNPTLAINSAVKDSRAGRAAPYLTGGQQYQHTQQLSPGTLQDRSIPRGALAMENAMAGSPVGRERRAPSSPSARDDNAGDALIGDSTAPRKRSKVSRACDECRRKKVRSLAPSLLMGV